MFLEQYKLEANPFAPNAARPEFTSHSMRYALLRVQELLTRQIQTLFLSGPAGVGKSTLVRQRFRQQRDAMVSWISPGCETREELFNQLLVDIGPGVVEGSVEELRNILEVYLRHQAGKGQCAFLVVDSLERLASSVLREFEYFASLRLRNRPIVQILALTRSEEMVANLLPNYNGGPWARAAHQRLAGFTLDETRGYIRSCLHGVGCEWAEELFPDEVVLDVQAFTRGVVGDINSLCFAALNTIAERSVGSTRQPRVTRVVLKECGTALNLRFDPSAWEETPVEEVLTPGAVQFNDPNDLRIESARLLVTSGKSVIADVSLSRPRMVLGRDDSCDISLDSRYVSRFQNLFMETPEGWLLLDLSSTNGCFVNGRRVKEHRLRDGDLIGVGQHQIRFISPHARVGQQPPPSHDVEDEREKTDTTLITSNLAILRPSGS